MKYSDFLARAKDKFGDKYRYIQKVGSDTVENARVVCEKHGIFVVNAEEFLNSDGCNKCKCRLSVPNKHKERNYVNTKPYKTWSLLRSKTINDSTYKFFKEWNDYSVFLKWYEKHYKKGCILRHDLLNSKRIDPLNCLFIPKKISLSISLGFFDGNIVHTKKGFKVKLYHDGKCHYLGTYETREEALKTARDSKIELLALDLENSGFKGKKLERMVAYLKKTY